MRQLVFLCSGLLLVLASGCKNEDTSDSTEASKALPTSDSTSGKTGLKSSTNTTAKLYEESLGKAPCSLLTPAMVSVVAQVPSEELEKVSVRGFCSYEWSSGRGGKAEIGYIKVYKSANEAKTNFDSLHKGTSAAELKAGMAAIKTAGASAELTNDKKDKVELTTNTLANSLPTGFSYEAVSGIGDAASYETTRGETVLANTKVISYANKIDVVTGNLSFGVTFSLNSEFGKDEMFKEQVVALGKAVFNGLGK